MSEGTVTGLDGEGQREIVIDVFTSSFNISLVSDTSTSSGSITWVLCDTRM
jgi:hypothetical protein